MANIQTLMSRLEKLEASRRGKPGEGLTIIIRLLSSDGNGGMAPGQDEIRFLQAKDGGDVLERRPEESEADFIKRAEAVVPANALGMRSMLAWSLPGEGRTGTRARIQTGTKFGD